MRIRWKTEPPRRRLHVCVVPTNIWRHRGTTFWRHARQTQINVHPFPLGRDLLRWSKQEPASNDAFVQRCKSTDGRATQQNAFRETQSNDTSRWRTLILRTLSMPRNRGCPTKNSSARVQASLTTENRRAARNVCVSSQEPWLPKHKQQTKNT